MNKDQRKYLTEWVDKGFNRERDEIESRRFSRPSLNNYLTAAALAGTLQLHTTESIRDYVQDQVKTSGKDDVLVTHVEADYGYYSSKRRRRTKPERHEVTLEAERVFIVPEEYLSALEKWEANEKDIEEKLKHLESIRDTILLKVNIGSDKALESVIAQADSLGSLDLVNRQLTSGVEVGKLTK